MTGYQKYSEKNNPVYKGMLGCFDFHMMHRNDKDEATIDEEKNMKDTLLEAVQDPDYKDMINCAYNQELIELEAIKPQIGDTEYKERIYVLRKLGEELGLEEEHINTEKSKNSKCCLLF